MSNGWKSLCVLLSSLAVPAVADTVTWTAPDGYHYWTEANCWSDRQAPHAGADYLVAAGANFYMRTPSTDNVNADFLFAGDSLSVGTVGGAVGYVLQKTIEKTTNGKFYENRTVFNRVVLNNGAWVVGSQGIGNVHGPVTVNASDTAPFILMGAVTGDKRTLRFHGPLDGAGHLSVSRFGGQAETAGYGEVQFLGNNANFAGKFTVDGNLLHLYFGSNAACGNTPAALVPDAVTIDHDGVLGFLDNATLPATRGVTVGPGGGSIYVPTGRVFLSSPVAGPGNLEKIGGGHLFLRGAYTAGDLACAASILDVCGATITGSQTLTVKNGGGIAATTESLAGHRLVVEHGGTVLPYGADHAAACVGALVVSNGVFAAGTAYQCSILPEAGACDRIDVRGADTQFAAPMTIRLVSTALVNADLRLPVLTIPKSVRTVSAADFPLEMFGSDLHDGAVSVTLDFGTETMEGEEMQVVYAVYRCGAVTQVKNMGIGMNWGNRECWSDGLPAGAGKDYFLNTAGLTLRTPDTPNAALQTFPGRSLRVGNADNGAEVGITLKCPNTRFDDLRLYGGSQIATGSEFANGGFHVSGRISLQAPWERIARIISIDGVKRVLTLDADLVGAGAVCYCVKLPGFTTGKIVLAGDNAGFTGPISIYGDDAGRAEMTLVIDSESRLGGHPAAFLQNGIVLSSNATLHASQSVTLAEPNRALRFDDGVVALSAPAGAVFDVRSRLRFTRKAEVVLKGGGEFRLGAGGVDSDAAPAVARTVTVDGSTFRPVRAKPFGNATLRVQANAALALDAPAADATLAAYGLDATAGNFAPAAGARLRVTPDVSVGGRTFSVPVCTVAPAAADAMADTLAALAVSNDAGKGYAPGKWTRKDVTLNGAAAVTFVLTFQSSRAGVIVVR